MIGSRLLLSPPWSRVGLWDYGEKKELGNPTGCPADLQPCRRKWPDTVSVSLTLVESATRPKLATLHSVCFEHLHHFLTWMPVSIFSRERTTGWIEISFTTYTHRFFLEPSFKQCYAYYSCSTPDSFSRRYSNTVVNNNTKIASVSRLYIFRGF